MEAIDYGITLQTVFVMKCVLKKKVFITFLVKHSLQQYPVEYSSILSSIWIYYTYEYIIYSVL